MVVNFSEDQLKKSGVDDDSDEKEKKSIIDKINGFLLKLSKVPLKERLFFVRHLGIMLKSGISLSTALKTLAEQTENKYFKKVLSDVGVSVEKGSTFADSLKIYQKVFGAMFISMVEAGELSGKLEDVLQELYIQMKKENALISKVKGAMTYPAVIIIAMIGIGTFMIVVIIPRVTSTFVEMQVELPLPTKILIGISNAVIHNGLISIVSLIAFFILIFQILKTTKGKFIFQSILLKMPIFGPIIKKINIARFARNISSLLKTDIMIIKTFTITANVISNLHYKNAILDMASKIKKGGKLNEVIRNYPKLFNPVVTQMVAIGEDTGELDNILAELAEFYEEEVDQIMENLPSIIEPVLILLLGVGVGGVAIAIIMPMYSLTSAI